MADNQNSVDVIATKTGFSAEWVGNLLELAAAPTELQMMVADDVIKPTFAIDVIKEHGDKALAVLQAALARKTGVDPANGEAKDQVGEQSHDNANAADATSSPQDVTPAASGDEVSPAPKKVRLTAKDLVAPEVRKFNNKVQNEAVALYKAASTIKNDAGFGGLSAESREALLQVLAKLEKYEVKGEPAVDPRQVALFDGGNAPGAQAAASTAAT
jgi:hypothetical protein